MTNNCVQTEIRTEGLRFLSFPRTFEKFEVENGLHPEGKVVQPPLRYSELFNRAHLWVYAFQRTLPGVVDNAFIMALFAHLFSTILYAFQDGIMETEIFGLDYHPFKNMLASETRTCITDNIKLLSWFNIFVISSYLNNEYRRWGELLSTCWRVQGRIHDIGLYLGSLDLKNKDLSFNVYRLLNAAHILVFMGVDYRLRDPDVLLKNLVDTELLQESEAQLLKGYQPKMRDAVIRWVGEEVLREAKCDTIPKEFIPPFLDRLGELRGTCAGFHDRRDAYPPGSMRSMCQVLLDLTLMSILLFYPIAYVRLDDPVQINVFLSVFVCSFVYSGIYRLINVMAATPFDVNGDCINVDALLLSTDFTLRTQLLLCREEQGEEQGNEQGKSKGKRKGKSKRKSNWSKQLEKESTARGDSGDASILFLRHPFEV
jgi:hypothetical protein